MRPRRLWLLTGIILISFSIMWWLRLIWIPLLPTWATKMQSWTREWGDTIQSLDSLVTVLLVVLGGTLSFLGLRGQSVKEEIRPTEGMPLRSSSLQVMLEEKLAGGSTIKWVDRDLTDVGDVLTQGRMALIGPSRIGKTREALELIRKVISRDYVNEQRISIPSPKLA